MGSRVPFTYDADGILVDALDRQQPDTLQLHKLIRAIPGLADQFLAIPDGVWTTDVSDAGHEVALIACPCGDTPEVEVVSLSECTCHRFFMFTGQRVLAANRPGQYGDDPVDPEAPVAEGDA